MRERDRPDPSPSVQLIMVKTLGEMDSSMADVLKRGQMQSQFIKQGQMQSQVLKRGQMQSNVLKQRQMQSDELTRQFNSPTKPSLAGPTKGQNEKNVVDAPKFSSPRVKRKKTGPNQLSYRESNVSTKHALSEDIEGTTELKRLPTPIYLFEDECIFCHSFRTSQFYGPMVIYRKGRIVSIDEGNASNSIYVHKNCLEWAPRVWFAGDIVVNLESEIRRALRLRCRRCGLLGAALGCYYKGCRKSFHVPCAVQIIGCRWDNEGHVLCPEHVSKTLPCEELSTHMKENDSLSSLRQSQCSHSKDSFTNFEEEGRQSDQLKTTHSFLPVGQCTDKEGKFDDNHRENQQTYRLSISKTSSLPQSQPSHKQGISTNSSRDIEQTAQLNTMSTFLPGGPYIDKEVNFDNHPRKNQQTDQFNISNPSYLPHSQCSKKGGISTSSSRDGQQIDQLDTSISSLPLGKHSGDNGISKNRERDDQRAHKSYTSNLSSLHHSCHPDEKGISNAYEGGKIKADQPDTSSCPSDQLVLLGSSLNASEQGSLQDFAFWTNATLTKEWATNVTHVIVGKGAGSSWRLSFEVLMAILLGKWVVHFEWIADCTSEMTPRPEASYEVALSMDSLGAIDGPKKGRIRATNGAPNLFTGLRFCLSAYMSPDNRHRMRGLIAAAEGRVLEGGDLKQLLLENSDGSSVKPYLFVYDGDAPGEFALGTLREEVEEAKKHQAAGARVICHSRVLDAVAAYDAEILDVRKDRSTS